MSMMFRRSGCVLARGQWLRNQETPGSTAWFHTPTDQCGIWKIFATFDFHISPQQRHIGARGIPCHCISIEKYYPCWPIYWQSKPSLKLLDSAKRSEMTFVWIHIIHGSHKPWKVLEFNYSLEKCLICQSALKIGNSPWKVLENYCLWACKIKAQQT